MANLTTVEINRLLDLSLGTGGASGSYMAAFTTAPNIPLSTGGVEVSGNAYARQQVNFAAASGGSKIPAADVLFPEATGSWGTVVVGVGIYDSLTSGGTNVLKWYATLTTPGDPNTPLPKLISAYDRLVIKSADASFSMS